MNCSTSLFSWQQRAVDKLIRSRVGALFMDMGTGKSRTVIEFVRLRQSRIARVVWFCPVSLKETVRQEILKHTDAPEEQIYVFDETTDQQRVPLVFWYVVGIESMSSSARVLRAVHYLLTIEGAVFAILDESSYIKTPTAKRTWRTSTMCESARYRMILTGTPISQGVVDLYAQMRFLSPNILKYNSFYAFAKNHLEYSEKYPGMIVRTHNVEQIAAKIEPYVYQVTKAECMDLPEKLHEERWFSMTREQEKAYEQAKWEILGSRPLGDLKSYDIFRLFTALQEIASGFWNQGDKTLAYPCLRLDTLVEVLQDIPAGEKVIVWCKFVKSLDWIAARLCDMGGVSLLYGDKTERERTVEIEAWRASNRFLVATQSTGGHGLTLNEAHYVIFYENGFKYSERAQAEDRCHRYGQTLPVTYIDIAAHCGIERKILKALDKKEDVVKAFRRQVDTIKDNQGRLEAFAKL